MSVNYPLLRDFHLGCDPRRSWGLEGYHFFAVRNPPWLLIVLASCWLGICRAAKDAFDAIAVTGQNFMSGHGEGPVLLHAYSDLTRVTRSCRDLPDWATFPFFVSFWHIQCMFWPFIIPSKFARCCYCFCSDHWHLQSQMCLVAHRSIHERFGFFLLTSPRP